MLSSYKKGRVVSGMLSVCCTSVAPIRVKEDQLVQLLWAGLMQHPCGVRQAPEPSWEKRRERDFNSCYQEKLSWGSARTAEVPYPYPECSEIKVKPGKVSERGCESSISSLKIMSYNWKIQFFNSGMYLPSLSEQYQHTLHRATPKGCSAISWVYS